MQPQHVLQGLVQLVVLVFSVVVHENAHGIAAARFGDTTARGLGRITMNPLPHLDPIGSVVLPILAFISQVPMIGWAKPVPVVTANLRNPVVHGAYVAGAGPASNLILAVLTTVVYTIGLIAFVNIPVLHSGSGNLLLFFQTFCGEAIKINCVLALFNLVPVPPLDGHWILIRYLPSGLGEKVASIRPYGFFILIGLLWTGILWRIIGPPFLFLSGGLLTLAHRTALAF